MCIAISIAIGIFFILLVGISKIGDTEINLLRVIKIRLHPRPHKEWKFKLLYCALFFVVFLVLIPLCICYPEKQDEKLNVSIVDYPTYIYPQQVALVKITWSNIFEHEKCNLECSFENAEYALYYPAEQTQLWGGEDKCVLEIAIPGDAKVCGGGRFIAKIRHSAKGVICSDETKEDVRILPNGQLLYPSYSENVFGYEIPVGGSVFGTLETSDLWLLVRPASSLTYYIQDGPLQVTSDYQWSTVAVLGEPGLLIGERFDIILVSADWRASSEWQKLIIESKLTGELPNVSKLPLGVTPLTQTTVFRAP
jgi:hypothetical protein